VPGNKRIEKGGLQDRLRDFKALAQNSLGYRYTIRHKQLILQRFIVEIFANGFANGPGDITAPVVSVQPLLNRPRNSLRLTVFVAFAALSSDMALFFPLTDSDQVSARLG
jgi:hypothetical protein